MQTWYEAQDYYCSERYERIVAWTEQELIDFYDFVRPSVNYKTA